MAERQPKGHCAAPAEKAGKQPMADIVQRVIRRARGLVEKLIMGAVAGRVLCPTQGHRVGRLFGLLRAHP